MKCPFCLADNAPEADFCFNCASSRAASPAVRRGWLIGGRYEVLSPLGRGGMGTVFKAHDRTLDEIVAVKVLRTDLNEEPESMARRFRLEIKLARRVRHRNVCAIHDYGEDAGLRYITMEFVDGHNLKQLVHEQGALPFEEACDVGLQILEGLAAIHEVGIVHRDVKTSNIMRDGKGIVRLMDFGIAHEAALEIGSEATLGTPYYLSPEQARGQSRLEPPSDIYSAGIVLFELLTGELPFCGPTPQETLRMQVYEEPPLDGPLTAALPLAVRRVLAKALAKDASRRYTTAAEFARGLRQARREPLAEGTEDVTISLMPETPLLAGNLQEATLPALLAWIADGSKTGTLELGRRTLKHRVVFKNGRLHSSWSNDPRRSLGQFLLREGFASEDQVSRTLLEQEDRRGDDSLLLGDILLTARALTSEQLRRCLRLKAEETLYDLLLRPEGEFEFAPGGELPVVPVELDLPIDQVLREWHRHQDLWSKIRSRIPSLQTTFRLRETTVVADTRVREVLVLAASGRTLAEISLGTRRSEFDVGACLLELCERGILAIDQVGDEAQLAETVGAIHELLTIAEQRFGEKRYEAAADAYEAVLALDPLSAPATRGLVAVEQRRQEELAQKAAFLARVPVLQKDLAALQGMDIDAKEAFVVSRINSQWDVRSILTVCPLPEEEVFLAFSRLIDRGVITLR